MGKWLRILNATFVAVVPWVVWWEYGFEVAVLTWLSWATQILHYDLIYAGGDDE